MLFQALNFELNAGQCLLVEGRNGCGKTTLLKTLATLRSVDEGQVLWNKQCVFKARETYTAAMQWMGHLPALKGDLTAFENLRFSTGLHQAVSTQQLQDALEQIGLKGYEDLPTRVLSQGQKKKALLANLLVRDAVLWILDEPFVGLDVDAVALLLDMMNRHLAANGMLILTTHQKVNFADQNRLRTIRLDDVAFQGGFQ